MSKALDSVLQERKAQDTQWGEQNHDPLKWLAILSEEIGEFSEAILKEWWDGRAPDIREEAVQVAAVALAIVECCDHKYKETAEAYMRCSDQARYHVIPMPCRVTASSTGAYACIAHLVHIVDRLGVDGQEGECVPLYVRRLPDE